MDEQAGRLHRGWFTMRKGASALVFFYALLFFLGAVPSAQAKNTPLSKEHKRWLKEEVVYIINDDEKKVFKALPTEEAREKFIRNFWELRDSIPATPENEYKEEHYRRIEYANKYFGVGSGQEGWRTDRGRIYIQLGEPKTSQQWKWLGQIRPIELWFYANFEHPSLPQFFNILFFQKFDVGDYEIYSPYLDGPDKLVKQSGTENNPQRRILSLRG